MRHQSKLAVLLNEHNGVHKIELYIKYVSAFNIRPFFVTVIAGSGLTSTGKSFVSLLVSRTRKQSIDLSALHHDNNLTLLWRLHKLYTIL